MSGLDSYKRIDVRYLHRRKYLQSGYYFSLSWNCGGEPSGDIRVAVGDDCLTLIYRFRDYSEEWQDVRERVYLDWTRCNYGGKRPWFKCPGCRQRVGILAAASRLFLCRHCYRLKYSSQLETDLERAQRKRDKLRERLGEKEWLKPKGMHQKTFDRLRARLIEAEMRADEIWCMDASAWLGRLKRR